MSTAVNHDGPRKQVPALSLAPGDVLQLQRLYSGDGNRYQVKLLALEPGQSLTLSTPMTRGLPLLINEEESVLLRFMGANTIQSFKTKVTQVRVSPYPHMQLAYPSHVESIAVRGAQRVHADLIAAVVRGASGDEVSAQLLDISITGARLRAHEGLAQEGERITVNVSVSFAGAQHDLHLLAVVRNVRRRGGGRDAHLCDFGVEFSDVDHYDRIFLQGFIHEQLVHGRAS